MRRMLVGVVLLVVLSACGGAVASQTASGANQGLSKTSEDSFSTGAAASGVAASTAAVEAPAAAVEAPAQPVAGQSSADQSDQQMQRARQVQAQRDRLVVQTATVQLLVDQIDTAEEQVRKLASSSEGFVLSAQASGSDDQRQATITFKVPVTRFNDALNALTKLAVKVESREVKGEDVTDQFVDLDSRLKNMRAVEARYLQFLQDSKTLTESLTVSDRLGEIQGQIEETQGRMTFLRESAAMSTITASMHTKAVVATVTPEGWSPATVARAATRNLLAFGQVLANIVIVIGVWAPVWLPLLLIAVWLRRRNRRIPPPTPQP